jgi:hypothetical protein
MKDKYKAILPKKRQLSLENFQKFRDELKRLKDYFFESSLYRPLGIDGKRFNNFIEKGDNLTLRPDMVLNLWLNLVNDQITRPRSDEGKIEQRRLEEQGPDPWLEQLGFQGINTLNQRVSEHRLNRLQQVVSSLCTRLLSETDFIQATKIIEQWTNERYRFPERLGVTQQSVQHKHSTVSPQKITTGDHFEKESAIELVKLFIEKREDTIEQKNAIKKEFCDTLSDMGSRAKILFSQEEIIGLFLSIDRKFDKRAEIYTRHSLGIELVTCDVTSPSMELPPYLRKYLGIAIGKEIKSLPQDLSQANITFKVRNSKEPTPLHWRFTSTGTILANLVFAVERGLGYRGYLVNLQPNLTTLGLTIDSLCNFIATYNDQNGQVYRGQWVDMDSIRCFVMALIICGEDWLYNTYDSLALRLIEQEDQISKQKRSHTNSQESEHLRSASDGIHFFFEQLQVLAKLQNSLYKNNIYAYRVNPTGQQLLPHGQTELDILFPEIHRLLNRLFEVEKIYNNLLDRPEKIYIVFKNFIQELLRIQAFAHLFEARSATIRGEVGVSEKHIKMLSISPELGHANSVMLNKLKEAEQLLWALSTDNPMSSPEVLDMDTTEFWEHHDLNLLNNPKSSNSEPLEYDYPSIDDYLAIAELYGNTARINFYKTLNYDRLKLTATWFEIAAFYASKIGYEKRCCHWLCMASRTWSRLGKWDRAAKFYSYADEIGQLALSPNSRVLNRSYLSEINLTRGEWFLFEENPKHNIEWALSYFIKALLGSAYRGYARRVADSLYNLGRAAKDERAAHLTIKQILDNKTSKSLADQLTPKIDSFKEGLDDVTRQVNLWRVNETCWTDPFYESLKLLKQCEEGLELDPEKKWADVADDFLKAAASAWNTWASQPQPRRLERKHSFEAKIFNASKANFTPTFLDFVPKPKI